MIHLFFVTSISEAKETVARIKYLPATDSFFLISNSPSANLLFTERRLSFRDSGDFFPAGKKLRSHQLKITGISKQWAKLSGIDQLLKYRSYQLDDIVSFSIFIYFAEIEHSLMVAQNILKNVNPDVIHVSRRWTESPFRRYQTENLNLENIVLLNLAKSQSLKIEFFSHANHNNIAFIEIFKTFAQTLIYSYKQLTVKYKAVNPEPIIILSHHYQLKNLDQLLTKFKSQNNYLVIGNADSNQSEQLKSDGIKFTRLDKLFPNRQSFKSTKFANFLHFFRLWRQWQSSIKNYFDSKDPTYWPMVKRKFEYYFLVEFPQIIEYLEMGKQIFSGGKTKVLLANATNDIISKCYALTAASNGVKVIELQHGLVVFDEEAPFRTNDIHAVWGNPLIKIVNQGNRNRNSLSITGFPYFDKYRNIKTLKHVSTKTPTILILATFPVAADRLIAGISPYQFIEMIFNAFNSKPENWKIIFRPHPSCNASWVKEVARGLFVNLTFDQRGTPLDQTISSCDVVISNFTSAMIDAMFIGKPILLYSFADQDSIKLNWHPLITSGAAAIFNSSNELKNLLAKVAINKDFVVKMKTGQKEFLKSYCSVNSDSASKRLLNLINYQLHK